MISNTLICEIQQGSKGSGYLSKELINEVLIAFKRVGYGLTDLYISKKDVDDVAKWANHDIDPVTKHEIFQATEMNNIWHINIHKMQKLNKHISGKDQIFGFDFNNSTLSEDQKLRKVKKCFSGNKLMKMFAIGLINRKSNKNRKQK